MLKKLRILLFHWNNILNSVLTFEAESFFFTIWSSKTPHLTDALIDFEKKWPLECVCKAETAYHSLHAILAFYEVYIGSYIHTFYATGFLFRSAVVVNNLQTKIDLGKMKLWFYKNL